MVQVVWTRRAALGLRAIRAYVRSANPIAAERLTLRLIAAAQALETLPERGRRIAGNRRELTVVHPYLIRYRFDGESVIITEIRHGARSPD
jgi:plasmid stabilization system protein ParE